MELHKYSIHTLSLAYTTLHSNTYRAVTHDMPHFYIPPPIESFRAERLYLSVFSAIAKRRQCLCSEFLFIAPRWIFMLDHEKANDRCNASQTPIENEHQFEACCIPV